MPKAVLESLDGVDGALHDLYEEKDGKFYLSLEGIDEHPSVAGLKASRDRLLKEKKAATDRVAALEAQVADLPEDFDPTDYERLKAEDEARKNDPNNQDVRKQIDTAVAAARQQEQARAATAAKKLEDRLSGKDEELARTKAQLNQRIIDDDLTSALMANGVTKPAFLKAAKAMLASEFETIDEDGKLVARTKAELGAEDVEHRVASFVQTDDGKSFVEPAKGGGAEGNRGGRSGEVNPWSDDHFNLTEQGKIMRMDRPRAERLARAAGKKLAAA